MGLAVATVWLHDRPRPPRAVALLDRRPWVAWALALVAFWVVATRIGIGTRLFEPMTPWQYLERHLLYAVIGVALVAPAVIGTPGRGWVRRLLANPVLTWLGVVSYGIYLWHLTALSLLERWGFRDIAPVHPYLAWPLAALALTALVAGASWYGLERPVLGLKRLVPRTRRGGAEPTALAPAER
jgi:peptidoglycan/LPS O-acetylase OafA/YrhL